MRVLNYGSLNIDKVYDVEHFVRAEETILSEGYAEFLGGKGLNQSVALAKAGAQVFHMGAVGTDGEPFFDCLREAGADIRYLRKLPMVSGHAIIQSVEGQNCIIVCGGANGALSEEQIGDVISRFGRDDLFLVQNEVAHVSFAMRCAKKQGMRIAFNASPITPGLMEYPLELVDYFLVNEVEAKALAGTQATDYEAIMAGMREKFPRAAIVMTLGEDGVWYEDGTVSARHDAYRVSVVDTTAAGDTFCGYFISGLSKGMGIEEALCLASRAGALAVGKKGASNSIPLWSEVEAFQGGPKQQRPDA